MVKEEITDDEGGDHKLPHNTLVNKITEEVVDEDGTVHDNSAEGMGICLLLKSVNFLPPHQSYIIDQIQTSIMPYLYIIYNS